MMEHAEFGYKETDFEIVLGDEQAGTGTLIKGLLPQNRRSLEEPRME